MTTAGTKTVTVSYTEGEVSKTATYNITVNEYEQPTQFSISLNDAFFGTSFNGTASGITDETPVSGTSDNVTVTYAGGGSHYINNSQIRFYPNNKLTVEAPSGYKISKIVFTADGTWTATISADNGTYTADTKTWTGDAASVVFTGSGSGQCRMSSMAITLADPNALPTPTVTINVPQSFNTDLAGETNVSAGTLTASVTHDDSAVEGATVTWSSSDTNVATINESTGAVTLVAVGTATITATFAGNDDYAAATGTYTFTVTDSQAKGGANNPYTVAEALAAATGTQCYVQGIVCSVSSTSVTNNGQIHYYISADGTEDGDVMNIYNGLGLNGAAFTSIDDIAVGDQVVVYGTISAYQGANQMAANNYLYSHITKAASNLTKTGDITLSAANLSTTATATDFFTTSSTGDITYEIADVNVATVDANGVVTPVAAGATTLTVSQEADATYKTGSITINVTVEAATKEDPITYETDKELAYGETFTLTYNDDYLTDGEVTMVSSNPAVASVEGLTITAAAVGTATITVTYAAGVTYNAGNSTFTVTVTAPAASETAQASGFEKVTATSDITAGQYLIVYEDGGVAFDSSLETLDAVGNTIEVTISEGKIAVSDETTAAAFTIDPEAGTLTNAAGKYIGKTASGNGLDVKDEAITNTFAIDNGNAVITASGGSVLKFNSSNNQNRFRYYGSGQQAIQLYKLSSGPTVRLNTYGYATYCSKYPLDFTDAEANGYSAWAITGVEGENITFSQITGAVPGGTGVLLKGTAGTTVQLVSAASNSEPENLLEGTLAPTYVEANQWYGLSGNTFKKINAGTVPAHKAMLPASAVSSRGVKAFTFVFGDTTTGVNAVDNGQWTMDNGAIFSLSGQRLAKPQKGINIINGKKVLVK